MKSVQTVRAIQANTPAAQAGAKDVIAIAFQINWNSVAKECTEVYGPEGVGYDGAHPYADGRMRRCEAKANLKRHGVFNFGSFCCRRDVDLRRYRQFWNYRNRSSPTKPDGAMSDFGGNDERHGTWSADNARALRHKWKKKIP
ncbi:Amylopullulanase [Bifidobacterium hapali]|uniref:Amylopullulanase n=1 Tax=Bifidobacterium hapali TaxID=1630172 RepID=A0A261FX25_9BIFI|nr:hypothetical protein [Bifidobacterium hapali]OZG63731.1 Amylopullulanase [Bifidobacterium hapali]